MAQDQVEMAQDQVEMAQVQVEMAQVDPVEFYRKMKQDLSESTRLFVAYLLENWTLSSENYNFLIMEKHRYVVIEEYEYVRKFNKSDEEAERLYAAMCKANIAYYASREEAISYRDQRMRDAGSVSCWLDPL